MLKTKRISIPLAGPLDESKDVKVVAPEQVVSVAKNVCYTKHGTVAKAKGWSIIDYSGPDAGTKLRPPHTLASTPFGLVAGGFLADASGDSDQDEYFHALVRGTADDSWEKAGYWAPIAQSQKRIHHEMDGVDSYDACVDSSGQIWTAWIVDDDIWYKVVDGTTGAVLQSAVEKFDGSGTAYTRVALLAVGDYVHFIGEQASLIEGAIGDITALTVGAMSRRYIAGVAPAVSPIWDACVYTKSAADAMMLAYISSVGNVVLNGWEANGTEAVQAWGSAEPAREAIAVAQVLATEDTDAPYVAVAWVDNGAGAQDGDVMCSTRNIHGNMLPKLAPLTVVAHVATTTVENLTISHERGGNEVSIPTSTYPTYIVWAQKTKTVSSVDCRWIERGRIKTNRWNLGIMIHGQRLASRAMTYKNRSLVWLCNDSTVNPVASLVASGSGVDAAHADSEVIKWIALSNFMDTSATWPTSGLTNFWETSTGILEWVGRKDVSSDEQSIVVNRADFGATGLKPVKMDRSVIFPGGRLMTMDGAIRDFGFAHPPEILSSLSQYAGGAPIGELTENAIYKYLACYEWTDQQGLVHRSAPCVSEEVTIGITRWLYGQSVEIVADQNWIDMMLWEAGLPNERSFQVPAGTYDSMDDLCKAIQDAWADTYSDPAIRIEVMAEVSRGDNQLDVYNATRLEFNALNNPADEAGTSLKMYGIDWATGTHAAKKAEMDFAAEGCGNLDTVIDAHIAGDAMNAWTVQVEGAVVPGVIISVDTGAKTVHIAFETTVSTVADVEAAITALAGANNVIGVKTAGTGGSVLNSAADDLAATNPAGGQDDLTCAIELGFTISDVLSVVAGTGQRVILADYTCVPEDAQDQAKVELRFKTLCVGDYDRMKEIRVAIFRTMADGVATYYFTGYADNNQERVVSYIDYNSDDTIQVNRSIYSTGEADDVLENATPIGHIICAHRGRVWVVDSENPRTLWASKPKSAGVAPEFSREIQIQMPHEIVAMASMGQHLVAFATDRVYAVSGSGPNALGVGSFTHPEIISADTGATDWRSVAEGPRRSVLFHGERGMWALTGAGNIQEIGAQIEDLLDGVSVLSILSREQEQEVWFLLDDGTAVVMDTKHNRWAEQSGLTGICDIEDNGGDLWLSYSTGKNLGALAKESATYQRGGESYSMEIQTGWIKLGALAGWGRSKWEYILGEWKAAHSLVVERMVDYVDTTVQTKTSVLATNPAPYVVRLKPAKQQATAIKIKITDTAGSGTEQAMELTAIEFEVGTKRGTHRPPKTL